MAGLFHVQSLPRINSLMTHMPETLKWAFKLRRRKFSIEASDYKIITSGFEYTQ